MPLRSIVTLAALVLFSASNSARADSVADFYHGRSVNLVVGYGPGGGYDLYARLVARHIGRFIPGNPSVVVQNMPGAGSLRAANFLYGAAPGDGATIGTVARDMPLLARSSALFPACDSTRANSSGSARLRALPTMPMC